MDSPIDMRGSSWTNTGFSDYIEDNNTIWEKDPLTKMAADGELMAFEHSGFWQPLDTLRDKNYLEDLWIKETAPWKIWS